MAVADAVASEQTKHETEVQELLIETRKNFNEEKNQAMEALDRDHITRLEHEVAKAREEGKSEGLQEGAAVAQAEYERGVREGLEKGTKEGYKRGYEEGMQRKQKTKPQKKNTT